MFAKYFLFLILFYFFAVLQYSFFPYFFSMGIKPNLIFGFFVVSLFFSRDFLKKEKRYSFIFYPLVAGFFLDLFSTWYMGFYILFFLFLSFIIKKLIENFFEKEDKYPFFYFLIIFLLSYLIYSFFDFLVFYIVNNNFPFTFLGMFQELFFTFLFSCIIFLIYKKIFIRYVADKEKNKKIS